MKPIWRVLLGLMLFAIRPLSIQAQDDYVYTTNADGVTLTITVYNGPGGDVTIPATNNGLQVVNIAEKAFEETGLTSVTIPDGITNIGNWAFFSCDTLTSATIPGSVTAIGDSAFDNCTSLTSVTMTNGVLSIGEWAFSDCVVLTSMTIPDTVTSIGDGAFFECYALTNGTIPAGVTNIGVNAFYNCTSLSDLMIPASVSSIGTQSFESCSGLTNLTIAEGVTNIGYAAFYLCTGLTSVTLPDSLATINPEAFEACVSLVNLTFPAGVSNIGDNAFSDCSALVNVYFMGNAPTVGSPVFLFDTNAKAYYMPGTTGWKSPFAGLPAELLPTNIIKLLASPPQAEAKVSGAGRYPRDSNVLVTAFSPNTCYEFVGWKVLGKVVSSNLDFKFMPTKNETLVATFALIPYTITTSASPTNWGYAFGGGKKNCGSTAILTAEPKPGFAFTEWTSGLQVVATKPVYRFSVGESESFVANFQDIEAPTVRITAPTADERVATAAFTIKGTASDNAAVEAVYYNINEAGWQLASTTNGFKTWFVDLSLAPTSTNTVSAYSEDTSGNLSKTVGPIKFFCTADGNAMLSIAGERAEVAYASSPNESFPVSFGSGAYVKMPANQADEGEAGTYIYTPTGHDTAELTPRRLLPRQDAAAYASTLELTFTDAYTASFTNLSGASGTFSFAPAEESVPANLDDRVTVTASFLTSNFLSTNSFGKSTFTTTDSLGRSSSGTYTFTPFTPVAGLVTETYSHPADMLGRTNYIIMTFKEGASRNEGVYYSEELDATGKLSSDIGGFH
jgi:hypothetical protein